MLSRRDGRRANDVAGRGDAVPLTSGADLGFEIGRVRADLDALACRVAAVRRTCTDPHAGQELVVVDGPFEGDSRAALDATELWLARAQQLLVSGGRALAEGHVSAGGLASR